MSFLRVVWVANFRHFAESITIAYKMDARTLITRVAVTLCPPNFGEQIDKSTDQTHPLIFRCQSEHTIHR